MVLGKSIPLWLYWRRVFVLWFVMSTIFLAPLMAARAQGSTSGQPDYNSVKDYLGIRASSVPGLKGSFNEWIGYVDGRLYDATAGYEFSSPAVGLLFISDNFSSDSNDVRYKSPVSGPIAIVSEQDGILVLKTKRGTFETPTDDNGEGHGFVTFDHVETLRFDIRKRAWIR